MSELIYSTTNYTVVMAIQTERLIVNWMRSKVAFPDNTDETAVVQAFLRNYGLNGITTLARDSVIPPCRITEQDDLYYVMDI